MSPKRSKGKCKVQPKKIPSPKEKTPSETIKKKKSNGYRNYIPKLLKKVSPSCQISEGSDVQLDKTIRILAQSLSAEARNTCFRTKKKTISVKEVNLAIRLYFPDNLANKAIKRGKKALETVDSAPKSNIPRRREFVANLTLPVSFTEKFLREFDLCKLHAGKNAPIALTAALECVTSEILKLAAVVAQNNKHVTVSPRHIFLAISGDKDIKTLMESFNIQFMGVGVVPYIHPEFMTKKRISSRKRKSRGNSKAVKSSTHKFLPGTVALRDIRKLQKSNKTCLQGAPFERVVRKLVTDIEGEETTVQFSAGSLKTIQVFVEQQVINLFRVAIQLTVHAKREGIQQKDVELAWDLSNNPRVPKTDNIPQVISEGIKENGIERLGKRAGIKRKGFGFYPATQRYIYSLICVLLTKTLKIMHNRDAITVKLSDLEAAIRALGIHFTIYVKTETKKINNRSQTKETSVPDE